MNNRLNHPAECPKELYQLMTNCWNENPMSRPSFYELHNSVSSFAETTVHNEPTSTNVTDG